MSDAPATSTARTRFSGKLYLVLLELRDQTFTGVDGRSGWAPVYPVTYLPVANTGAITVPPGFPTDLASIPRWAWTLLPPDGPWVKAAVIHDYLYSTGGTGEIWGRPSSIADSVTYDRMQCDRIMLEAMADRGVDAFRRTVIYLALRAFGWIGWRVQQRKARPNPEAVLTAIERPDGPGDSPA